MEYQDWGDNQGAFDRICGDCSGLDIMDITEDDVRKQAKTWIDDGQPCSDEMIDAAITGLCEYQEEKKKEGI